MLNLAYIFWRMQRLLENTVQGGMSMETNDYIDVVMKISNCDFLDSISFEDIEQLKDLFDHNTLRIQTQPVIIGKKPKLMLYSKKPYNMPISYFQTRASRSR